MLEPTIADGAISMRLWGLVQTPDGNLPGEDLHKTFYVRNGSESGVLTFASALDAEIYRQQLLGRGQQGWQRAPLEHIDLERIACSQTDDQRRLMLALGFFASDTNNLLLDDEQMLLTPLLPVPYRMRHSLHGVSKMYIQREVLAFVEQWWEQVGGEHYPAQMRVTACWPDLQLAQSARDALNRAALADARGYHALWKDTDSGDDCAVFLPDTGAWQFSSLRGPRTRELH